MATTALRSILTISILLFLTIGNAQTKKIKRPNSRVGISSVDRFVKESFDIYDKVYMYDGYAEQGKPLDDNDIDVLEDALTDLEGLSDSAPNIIADLDGVGVLKQGKATLQINRAKKALKYSIKTAKELLLNQKERKNDDETNSESSNDNETTQTGTNKSDENPQSKENKPTNASPLKINSKFDFVPGDKLLFFDDFSNDFVGDFPSKWNTNGSGEVVTFDNDSKKWLELKLGYNTFFIPDLPNGLPENYTIEFDVACQGIDRKTSSGATLNITLEDNNLFKTGNNYARISMPFVQYTLGNFHLKNKLNNANTINNSVKADIRQTVLNKPHVSIAVNKQRFRLWVNQKKYVDVPRMIAENAPMKALKFSLYGFREGIERVFITNIKIAEGGVDLRRKLINEGSISTNGILFNSGSSSILPQSYGIIKQISQVLLQEKTINLKIVGHTDADGSDDSNIKLSKSRADAVKDALISIYGISADRLTTEGKGESSPVADNATAEGKAQNRRVEFITQ